MTRNEQKAQTRFTIRESAKELFIRQGFEATTSRQIASQAGVALGTIFIHFKDKHGLLEDILFEDIETVVKEAFISLPHTAPIIKQLLHLAQQLYSYYKRNIALSRELLKNNFFSSAKNNHFRHQVYSFIDAISHLIQKEQATSSTLQSKNADALAKAFMAFYLIVLTGLIREEIDTVEAALEELELLLKSTFN